MNRIHTHTAILGALAFAIAPCLLQLPVWIILWCLILWGYCFLSHRYNWPSPKHWVRSILTLVGFSGLLLTFAHHFDSDAYVGLISVAAGLKPLEIRSLRDRVVTIFLAYFLIIPSLLYSTSLAIALHMFLSVYFTTAVLIHVNHPRKQLRANFSLSARIMAQALPLLIILFFLFPRFQGSLWGLTARPTGLSGFTDHLTPESLSSMARSHKIAFRAEFDGSTPEPKQRYWRGLVFQQFDGITWSRGKPVAAGAETLIGKETVEYTLTLEPHNDKWLFALDLPIDAPVGARMLHDRTLVLYRSMNQRAPFKMKSYTVYNTGPFERWDAGTLKLPASRNVKSLELAQKLADTSNTPEEIVEKGLSFIRENNFQYTLNPPRLEKNPMDDFLFRTRKGYCGHYAAAFAYLMRAAKVPSRIVGGYLGGELNPFGNYLIIRHGDAHAWVEVWLPAKGWVRVDPTLVVAPGRIEQGPVQALPPGERTILRRLPDLGPISRIAKQIRLGFDALNTQWNSRILGYSYQRQKHILEKIGIKTGSLKGWLKAILLTGGLLGIFAALSVAGIFKKSQVMKDVIQQSYSEFCSKLGRIDLPRRPDQGPTDYAHMVNSSRNDLQRQVQDITSLYILLRYNRGGNREDLKRFQQLVKVFNPKRNRQADITP